MRSRPDFASPWILDRSLGQWFRIIFDPRYDTKSCGKGRAVIEGPVVSGPSYLRDGRRAKSVHIGPEVSERSDGA